MLLDPKKDIIAVHQMGKVGSTSVFAGVKAALPGFRIFHTHHYLPETIVRMIRKTISPEGVIPPHLRDSVELRHWVRIARREDRNEEADGTKIHVISLVRDPIARNISAFFENVERWIAKLPPKQKTLIEGMMGEEETANADPQALEEAIQKLQTIFTQSYKHEIAESWMTEELCEPMGVKFDRPFDHDKGYTIYEGEPIRVLVFQLERLDLTLLPAIKEFLGIEKLPVTAANKGINKRYAALYKKFVASIRLPESYLEEVYSGSNMCYFYSDKMIGEFRRRWSRPTWIV